MSAQDGGAAFPRPASFSLEHRFKDEGASGMTLRDWFAGQALAGMGEWSPATYSVPLSIPDEMQLRAEWAYAQADAMMAARAQVPS